MKTSLVIDDSLLAEAMRASGVRQKTAVIHLGLQELINRAAKRRLALLGGTMPTARAGRRRRTQK